MDLVSMMIEWETGEISEEDEIILFQDAESWDDLEEQFSPYEWIPGGIDK